MAGDRWTFLVLKDGEAPVRQISVTRTKVRNFVGGGVAVVLGVFAFAAWIGLGGAASWQAERLETRNQLLSGELDRLQNRISSFEGTLANLSEKDAQLRTLAGMTGIDSEVMRVGIGGPGLVTPESTPLWAVDSTTGARTFAASYDLAALERRASLLIASMDEAGDSLAAHRDLLEATPSILPTAGWLSSRFQNARVHPIHNEARPHDGVDIAADHGTPILAAAKGRVVRSGWVSGLGQIVEIDHGFGYVTRYGHASKLLVRVGQQVTRGQMIAQVGRTGIATGPHLHYEVRLNGQAQNPMNFVIAGGT